MRLGICSRSGDILEPMITPQWYVNCSDMAKRSTDAVRNGELKIVPAEHEKTWFAWLDNIRDWCISRQLWWGHQIPAWFATKEGENLEKNSMDNNDRWIVARSEEEALERAAKVIGCNKEEIILERDEDVLDTWFSSALWPFATLGWPEKKEDLKNFYPTDVLSTARDIINLWVARMIFSGMEFMGKTPFHSVFIHPTVLTKEGERMSKSLGTGIDPLNLCEKYGADATRFGIAWQLMGGQDIKFTEDNIVMGRKFCNKIWNASRYVLMQIPKSEQQITSKLQIPKSEFTEADKKIVKALDKTIKSVNKSLQDFQFGQAAHNLYDFFWHDFCDIYIEKSKEQNDEKTKKILLFVLSNSLKILHPFIPFITEEIYQTLPIKDKKQCLMVESWPQ